MAQDVNAMTGSVQHMMERSVVAMGRVTVVLVCAISTGLETPVSTKRTAKFLAEKAKTSAATLKEWCAPMLGNATVAAAFATTLMAKISSLGPTVSVMTASVLMRIQGSCVEAMDSVTVETVTARPVGMEINVNFCVTSVHGKANGDAHLQMARSAAIEEPVCVENVPAMTLIHQGTGVISMEIHASVMKEAATLHMTDIPMSFALVMVSVTVGGVTAKRAGPARSVSILSPVQSQQRQV